MPQTDDDILTREQAAELVQLPVPTLAYYAVRRMGPPFAKIGRHVRYRRGDVLAWIRAQRTGGAPTVSQ